MSTGRIYPKYSQNSRLQDECVRPLLKDTWFPVTRSHYASNLIKCAHAGAGIECNIL